jgi:hypothetical protein
VLLILALAPLVVWEAGLLEWIRAIRWLTLVVTALPIYSVPGVWRCTGHPNY